MADENKFSDKSDKSINDASPDRLSEIKNLRLRNVNKVVISNININLLLKKFEQLKELMMYILMSLLLQKQNSMIRSQLRNF